MITAENSLTQRSTDYASKAKALVGEMTLKEKALLISGTAGGVPTRSTGCRFPSVCMTDGPHGLRKVEGGGFPAVRAHRFRPLRPWLPRGTWDMIRQVGVGLAGEAQANDVQILLGPGVNMKRSPLGGRNFEYLSEDLLLAGKSAAAYIQGVQSQGVGTSIKHYAVNNQEFERMRASSNLRLSARCTRSISRRSRLP